MPKKFIVFFSVFLSVSSYLSILVSPISAYYTNMPASVVVGQPDFVSNTAGTTASLFKTQKRGVFVDPNGRLIVSDQNNSRVLIYNKVPTTNGASADLVLGQADFVSGSSNRGGTRDANTLNSPMQVWSDGTKLIVVDDTNGRVLIWNTFPTQNGQSADVVVGQADFTSISNTCDATKLRLPIGLAVYNGKLIVSSHSPAHRILIWNSIPTTNGVAADVVIGQTGMTTCSLQTISSSTFNDQRGIWVDEQGKLYVADTGNHRILIWNSIPTTNGASADIVIGQTNFTSSSSGTTASTFSSPESVFALNNRLFVPDTNNNRILIYNSIPTTNGASTDLVLGQSSFTIGSANGGGSISATGFNGPTVVYVNGNNLFVGDAGNSRYLVFNNVIDTPSMNINLPLEKIDNTHLRVRGNIQLGDRTSTYALQWVKAEVNGQGLGFVTNLGGGRDNGDNLTLYDFFHEFNPTTGVNTDMNNYTLKLVASSFNADTTSLFYFQPFNFDFLRRSGTSLNISFHINKYQIQKTKDNIDHFEIQTLQASSVKGQVSSWKKLGTNISRDLIDTNSGQVYVTIPNSLLSGIKYSIRMIAVSRDSNWQEPSNILNYFVPKKKK